jgi:hypothetical protein
MNCKRGGMSGWVTSENKHGDENQTDISEEANSGRTGCRHDRVVDPVAFGFSFLGATAAKRFCIASGAFYLTLATLGLTIGNPALNRAGYLGPMLLHTGDHIFHLVLGSIFLAMGLVSGRQ